MIFVPFAVPAAACAAVAGAVSAIAAPARIAAMEAGAAVIGRPGFLLVPIDSSDCRHSTWRGGVWVPHGAEPEQHAGDAENAGRRVQRVRLPRGIADAS
jgi:hypothetical protein